MNLGANPRKKRVSERVFPRVVHIIQFETLGETLGEIFHARQEVGASGPKKVGISKYYLENSNTYQQLHCHLNNMTLEFLV